MTGMTLNDAKKQAQIWWGSNGSADLNDLKGSPGAVKYVVGTTTLPARLGGHVTLVLGVSWKSFDDAFENAEADGWEPDPLTGFESDEAIEDEA